MKQSQLVLLSGVAIMFALGCGGDASSEEAKPAADAAATTSSNVCSLLPELEASLDALEDSDSFDEYESNYEAVKEDFAALRAADKAEGSKYAAELDSFETAMDEFGESLTSLGDGGILSGVLELASDAADLAVAGDRLDEAVDCPGT
ncbi:MAG: hypothetical protein JSW71_07175 [Gemmatimonadota bacterium]|nr:MAG: hypothetical protein JSW71_07175 [Gemmatimonadota bacterium]